MLNHVYSTSNEVIQVSGLPALQGLPCCERVGGSEITGVRRRPRAAEPGSDVGGSGSARRVSPGEVRSRDRD